MDATLPSISVVLPAFNEAENLAATVSGAADALDRLGADYEILVVDDGSTDETPKVCRELVARYDRLHVIRHPRNRGYGAALRSGFNSARCELIFLTDADGQFRFDHISEFLACLDKIDMVIGYRANRQDSWHRKLNSRIGNAIARALLGVRARDINCAYKLLRREALRHLPLSCDGAMISTELLALASRAGWRLEELPVTHFPRRFGQPTGARPRVILRTILEYFQIRRRLAHLEYGQPSAGAPRVV